MKLILSRKGMDSSFGVLPSPILPDGRLCWLPIPENTPFKPNLPTYDDIRFDGQALGDIVSTLSKGKVLGSQPIHLDPDLLSSHVNRLPGWKPMFGQTGAAERHLHNLGVGSGDLFVFFAWFRQTELVAGRLQYARDAPDLHVIYGWLQIEQRSYIDMFLERHEWMESHPHVQGEAYGTLDVVYRSASDLTDFSNAMPSPGAGMFSHMCEQLVLTAPGSKLRSVWRLPKDFFPGERAPLSYHANSSRWTLGDDEAFLRTVGRGQEFVLDLDHYPGVRDWVESVLFGSALADFRRRS